MARNLTPGAVPRANLRRRPWWARSYDWNLWWVLGVGLLLYVTFIAAWVFVRVVESVR